jgi:large subunit ribosomal protein L5
MHFIKHYEKNIVKYDLINKFFYKNPKDLPRLLFLSIRFDFKKYNFNLMIASLLALELITLQKSNIIKSKSSNISLKIRKGDPVGCIVRLRSSNLNEFLIKILNYNTMCCQLKPQKDKKNMSTSFKITNVLVFKELEQNYQFFKNLPELSLTLTTTTEKINEFNFLLKSYKLIK